MLTLDKNSDTKTTMQSYEILTFLICLAALFAYINHRFIKWPPTIGIMALSLTLSVIVLVSAAVYPQSSTSLTQFITSINFHSLLMNGLLGPLLFAGSIQIDAASLQKEKLPVISLATIGIFISTFLLGTLLYLLLPLFHLDVAYIHCLLFAALISPTDPVAVLAILKKAGISKTLELKISGESLFNDGVAVVMFITLLEVAQTGTGNFSVTDIFILFIREAGGGLLYGLLLGYGCYYAIKSIDKYEVEVLVTIAAVMGGYLFAGMMHISGPLAMVVAGIVIGNKGHNNILAGRSENHLTQFWELIDELLNAILFMLVGFEMLVIKINPILLIIGLASILLALFSRWVSVAVPVVLLKYKLNFEKNAIAILTWGGLRGGLSVALALSLPDSMHRDLFVTITYLIVVFSILVQGLTIGKMYRKLSV